MARECDGFVSVSSAAYESESLDAMRSWLAETNRPVYAVGPLVPPGYGDAAGLSPVAKKMEIDSSKNGTEFQTFLDKTLKSHGDRSLIYVHKNHILSAKRSGGSDTVPLFHNFRSHLEASSGLRIMNMYGL